MNVSKLLLATILSYSTLGLAGGAGVENPNTYLTHLECVPTSDNQSSVERLEFLTYSNLSLTRQQISFVGKIQGVRSLVKVFAPNNKNFFELDIARGTFEVPASKVNALVSLKHEEDRKAQGTLDLKFTLDGQDILLSGSIPGILEEHLSLSCGSL